MENVECEPVVRERDARRKKVREGTRNIPEKHYKSSCLQKQRNTFLLKTEIEQDNKDHEWGQESHQHQRHRARQQQRNSHIEQKIVRSNVRQPCQPRHGTESRQQRKISPGAVSPERDPENNSQDR